jgi:hypothetical protein
VAVQHSLLKIMMDKIIGIKPKQALDQSLISIGGWLRGIDAQIISFIRPEAISWTSQDFSLHQRRKASDLPEWIYPDRSAVLQSSKQLSTKSWYTTLKKSFAPWHTSLDWRVPIPNGSLAQNSFHRLDASASQSGSLAFSYAYASPIHQRMETNAVATVKFRQFPSLQLSEGLSQFWFTSYKFSTALAVLLPVAINVVQSPIVIDFIAQASRGIEAQLLSLGSTSFNAAPAALTTKSSTQMPRRSITTTGKSSNTQGYIVPTKGEFTSGYGMRWGRLHRGIDIAGPVGTPILAAAAGKVITAGWGEDGFGNKVEIQHPDGTITLYAHTAQVLTKVGVRVHQGERIAEMGSSGHSTGPHLHFQVHPGGKGAVDPMFFLGNHKTLIAARPTP